MSDTATSKPDAKRIRHIRMPDSLWVNASRKAAEEGMTISELVRVLLRDYLRS